MRLINRFKPVSFAALAASVLLSGALPANAAEAEESVLLSPYETTHYNEYDDTDPDNYFMMMGVHYTEGLEHNPLDWGARASYELDGQYELVTFEVGHIPASIDGGGHKLEIILDGEKSDTVDLKRSMATTQVCVNVKGIDILTLHETDYDQGCYGITNVRAYPLMPDWYDKYNARFISENIYETAGTGWFPETGGELLAPYEYYGLQYLDGTDPRASFMMTGTEYTWGLVHEENGWGSSAYFNLGKAYERVKITVGHIDNGGSDSHPLEIYLDGELYQTVDLTPDMGTTTIEINTIDVTQLILLEKDYNQTMYGFTDILGYTETEAAEPDLPDIELEDAESDEGQSSNRIRFTDEPENDGSTVNTDDLEVVLTSANRTESENIVEGVIRNNGNTTFRDIRLEVCFLDKDGNEAALNRFFLKDPEYLAPGEEIPFKAVTPLNMEITDCTVNVIDASAVTQL